MLHTGGRRRGKGQRLLYWFRTPPGVRVGRAPIDEEAIRLLEQHNPDVEFDWTRILKDPVPAESVRDAREPRDARDSRESRDRRERRQMRPPQDQRPRDDQHRRPREEGSPSRAAVAEYAEPAPAGDTEFEGTAQSEAAGYLGEPDRDSAVPDTWESEAGPEEDAYVPTAPAVDSTEPAAAEPGPMTGSAAYERLGAEALGRLRARYAEVMARIAEKPMEEEAREQLKLRAARLNPDGWVTADEVAAALEQYETVFEELRALVGRHPGRRRRR